MATTTLQIPIDKRVRDNAVKAAKESGFSSLQEVIRVLLNNFVEKGVDISFGESVGKLSSADDLEQASIADYLSFEEEKPSQEELNYYHAFIK